MLVCAVLSTAAGTAQTAINSVTYAITDSADQTIGGIRYRNTQASLDSITTSSTTYIFDGASANAVFVRRNTDSNGNGTPNQTADNDNTSAGYYQRAPSSGPAGGTTNVYGTYYNDYQNYLLNYNMFQGTYDTFVNGTTAPTNGVVSNIERIDYTWTGGYTVVGNEALSFFNIDPLNERDDIRISVFTAVDAQFTPTAYANSGLVITAGNYGANLSLPADGTTDSYVGTRYVNAGNNMSGTPSVSIDTNQGIAGTLISLADLGISAGTVIYGFSLMGTDVNAASASNLVNWNNTSIFPTNTGHDNGTHDFIMPGIFVRPVPEPSTYGAMFMGLIGLIWGGLRLRRPTNAT